MKLFKLNICILMFFVTIKADADLFCNSKYWRETTTPDIEYMLHSHGYVQMQDEQPIYDLTSLYEEYAEHQETPIQIMKREASRYVREYIMCEINSTVNSSTAFLNQIMDPLYWTGCTLYRLRNNCEYGIKIAGNRLTCQDAPQRWGGGSR